MLAHEETLGLIELAKKGDENAKSTLITENMPLIKSIVKRYSNVHVEYEDLLQLGAMGLVKAINNFKGEYNVRFSTYAVPMIAGEIKRFIRDGNSLRVSRSIRDTAYRILKVREKLETPDAIIFSFGKFLIGISIFKSRSSKTLLSVFSNPKL